MTDNEMLEQLEDLIADRKSFLSSDTEANEEFIKDIEALELIISKYENAVLKYKSPDIIYDDYFERVYNLQKLNRDLTETISNNVNVILYQRKVIDNYQKRCEKAIEYNNQIIKDTKDFYRPTTDIIYSGDSLIEIATNNINILQNGSDSQ